MWILGARGIMKRVGWERFGLRSASEFIRCVPDNDPQLAKTPTAAADETRRFPQPWMSKNVSGSPNNVRQHYIISERW